MNVETYGRPFYSLEAMYNYIAGCQFFKLEAYARHDLKANDRKKMAHRELYRHFVDVWLLENERWIRDRAGKESMATREEVTPRILDSLGKMQEYDNKILAWGRERAELLAKYKAKPRRKAEARVSENYADEWIKWLEKGVSKDDLCENIARQNRAQTEVRRHPDSDRMLCQKRAVMEHRIETCNVIADQTDGHSPSVILEPLLDVLQVPVDRLWTANFVEVGDDFHAPTNMIITHCVAKNNLFVGKENTHEWKPTVSAPTDLGLVDVNEDSGMAKWPSSTIA